MPRVALVAAKLLFAYVVAGAILVMYVMRASFSGHAHIPFSGFPEFLVWSPIAPALIYSKFSEHRVNGAISLLVFSVAFISIAWLLLRTRK
jgi:hypothetical protein